MTLDKSYQDSYPFLFAGNAGTLTVSGTAAYATVEVSARLGSVWAVNFTLRTNSVGYAKFDLAELMTSIEDLLPEYGSGSILPLRLSFSDGSTTLGLAYKEIYRGRIPESILSSIYSGYQPLTVRPQVYVTREDVSEKLIVLNKGGLSGCVCKAKIYFGDGTSATFTLSSVSSSATRYIPSVSYSAVRAIATGSYSSRKILAYDVWTVLGGSLTGRTMRYVVDRGKAEAFRFRGSFGVMENIWTRGSKKSETESETATLTNGGVERELTNDSRIIRENFTGHLRNAEEVRFWREFFASAERYAVIDGVSRRIIVDEIDSESTDGELSAFSFKWHYADRNDDPARIPVRQELKQYKPTI